MMNAPPTKRRKTNTLVPSANDATPSSSLDVARATAQLLAAQNVESRQIAARAVAAASDDADDDDDKKIASRDALRILVAMLRATHGEAETGALALWKLAKNMENKVSIAAAGAIPPLVALLQDGTDVAKENVAMILTHLAFNRDVSIAEAGAIPLLVALVLNGTHLPTRTTAT